MNKNLILHLHVWTNIGFNVIVGGLKDMCHVEKMKDTAKFSQILISLVCSQECPMLTGGTRAEGWA